MTKTILYTLVTITSLLFISCQCKDGDKKESDTKSMKEAPKVAPKVAKTPAVKKMNTNGYATKPDVGTKAWCPVMKNSFTVTKTTEFTQYKGKYYLFCCPGCKPKFEKSPEKYIKALEI